MGGGGNSGTSTTSNTLPPELRGLYSGSADTMLDLQEQFPLSGFGGENPLQVGGANPLESQAGDMVNQLWGPTSEQQFGTNMVRSLWDRSNNTFGGADNQLNLAEHMRTQGVPGAGKIDSGMNYAQQLAGRKVDASADTIANDAALQASQKAFEISGMPAISSKMSSMGLGRSSAHGGALANAWAQEATPHIMNAVQREQDRMNKMTDTQMGLNDQRLNLSNLQNQRQWQAMGARENALGLKNSTGQYQLGIADQMANLGQQNWNQMKGAIDTGMGVGGTLRGVENDQYKAVYDDFLRRQGMAEKALYAPFGQSGNMVGSQTTNTGGGK